MSERDILAVRTAMNEPMDEHSAARMMLRAAAASRRVRLGGGIVLFVLMLALFAPWLAPNDPNAQDLLNTLAPPFWANDGSLKYPLGTDSLGRCTLSRVIYGSRVALIVAVAASTGAMLLGTVLALIAGYFGGARQADHAQRRRVDVVPAGRAVAAPDGRPRDRRRKRHPVDRVRRLDTVLPRRALRGHGRAAARLRRAARLLGFSHFQTVTREVLPAVAPLVITLFSLQMGISVIVEAILSFVGLSVPASVTAWGMMIADARSYMHQAVWGMIAPILAIFVTVLGLNVLGDGLRQSLDPRLRHARI